MKTRSALFAAALALMLLVGGNVTAQQNKSTCCDLKTNMRVLWEDHITWTRNVIFNIIDELPGTNEAVARLLQNQTDIGNAIKPFYGHAAGDQLTTLLNEHITIAADLLTALDDGNNTALTGAQAKWVANADAISAFLSGANPAWPLADMTAMMREHLTLTTNEAVARKTGNYAADVAAYDAVHVAILAMADMLTEGIIRQFPQKFKGCPGGKNTTMSSHTMNSATIEQNYPNPAAHTTTISYLVPAGVQKARVIIYDEMGNVVKEIKIKERGEGSISINTNGFKKGVYKYSIIADDKLVSTKTLVRL